MQTFRFVCSFDHIRVIYAFLVVLNHVNTDSSHDLHRNKLSQVVNSVRDLNKSSPYHGKSHKEVFIIFGIHKNKQVHPTTTTTLKQVHNLADVSKDLADKTYDTEGGNKVRSLGQAEMSRKSQEIVESNSNEIDGAHGKKQFHDRNVDLTGREYTDTSTVKTIDMFAGSGNASHITRTMSWKELQRQKFSRMVRESPMLLGAGVGVSGSLIVALIVTAIYLLLKRRRTRCAKLQEVSFGTPKEEKPIYIKLSQLHRPKRSPNYVVTVLDESNFSIGSDVSSEEELFDLSAVAGGSPCKKNNLSSISMTSTPKKDNRFR